LKLDRLERHYSRLAKLWWQCAVCDQALFQLLDGRIPRSISAPLVSFFPVRRIDRLRDWLHREWARMPASFLAESPFFAESGKLWGNLPVPTSSIPTKEEMQMAARMIRARHLHHAAMIRLMERTHEPKWGARKLRSVNAAPTCKEQAAVRKLTELWVQMGYGTKAQFRKI
jgi:hypothetical protein